MADSPVFDHVCAELDRETDLSTVEARGTVRLALKDSGLATSGLNVEEAVAVVRKILPAALSVRGIDSSDEVCARIADRLSELDLTASPKTASPEAVFERLGRRR